MKPPVKLLQLDPTQHTSFLEPERDSLPLVRKKGVIRNTRRQKGTSTPRQKKVTIEIFDLIGSPHFCTSDDGEKIYGQIISPLRQGQKVVLSFAHVKTLIPAFLHMAIGPLYKEFSEEKIKELLSYANISKLDRDLIEVVISNVKSYYAHPKEYEAAWEEELGEDYYDFEE